MSYGEVGERVVIEAFGERPMDAIERHLAVVPQPPPDPASLRPDDVVIAVKSSAVGWVDLLMTSGQYQHMPKPPYTPGMEYAGEVAWVGPDAEGVAVGDRVIADAFLVGPRSLGEHQRWGGFASWAVAPANAVEFVRKCREDYGLPVEGLMCIPPADEYPAPHFGLLHSLAADAGVKSISMGMSADFEMACQLGATHVRIGSGIFGPRD